MNKKSRVISMADIAKPPVRKSLIERAVVCYVTEHQTTATQQHVIETALREYIDNHSADKKETKKAS